MVFAAYPMHQAHQDSVCYADLPESVIGYVSSGIVTLNRLHVVSPGQEYYLRLLESNRQSDCVFLISGTDIVKRLVNPI